MITAELGRGALREQSLAPLPAQPGALWAADDGGQAARDLARRVPGRFARRRHS